MSAEIERRLEELERRVAQLEHPTSPKLTASSPEARVKPSPREFLLERGPKSDNDRTLTAVYHIEMVGGQEAANFDDIEAWYHAAKEAPPSNRRDPPYQLVKKGYLREVGKRERGMKARNRWALTNLGIKRVEGGFKDTE
jgi:hypothetical protein